MVRRVVRERLTISGMVLAFVVSTVCFVPWIRIIFGEYEARSWACITPEGSLNLVWLTLAAGALTPCITPTRGKRVVNASTVVSVMFILVLLFPVMSASDDLAQWDLINDVGDSQGIAAVVKNDRQISTDARSPSLPAVLWSYSAHFLSPVFEVVSEPARPASLVTPSTATGNHSPPFC